MSSSPTNFWYTNPPYGIDGEWQGSGMVEFQLSDSEAVESSNSG